VHSTALECRVAAEVQRKEEKEGIRGIEIPLTVRIEKKDTFLHEEGKMTFL
jgi:hypothetical protein